LYNVTTTRRLAAVSSCSPPAGCALAGRLASNPGHTATKLAASDMAHAKARLRRGRRRRCDWIWRPLAGALDIGFLLSRIPSDMIRASLAR
jgi:hypothetical protein